MTIVFLDVDGVLLPSGSSTFSPAAVAAVKSMIAAGATVVMSSTWRSDRREEAEAMLEEAGIPIEGWISPDIPGKAAAIAEYLYDNWGDDWPEVVIIDDQAEPGWLAGAGVIVPDSRVGLVL